MNHIEMPKTALQRRAAGRSAPVPIAEAREFLRDLSVKCITSFRRVAEARANLESMNGAASSTATKGLARSRTVRPSRWPED